MDPDSLDLRIHRDATTISFLSTNSETAFKERLTTGKYILGVGKNALISVHGKFSDFHVYSNGQEGQPTIMDT
jgi:hypothetical protein